MAKSGELIGQNLKRIRELKGFSKESLAKAMGVSRQTIYTYEKGQGLINSEIISKLCRILEIEDTELLKIQKNPFEIVKIPSEQLDLVRGFFEQQKKEVVPLYLQEQIQQLDPQKKQWLFDLIKAVLTLDDEAKHSIFYQIRALSQDSAGLSNQKKKSVK